MRVMLVVKSKKMETLGVMYLSSIIKNGGHECKIVELEHSYHLAHVFGADIVGMSVMTGDMEKFKKLGLSVKNRLGCKVIVGGPDPTFFPEGYSWADEIVRGEAEQWAAYTFDSTYCICAIDNIPWPDRTDFPGFKIRDFITSRGCPYSCLTGDTVVHTMDGDYPIKVLVGREDVKVLSRNPVTQQPIYTKATNIRKTRENAELVRVNFDDGSHIDCTPDHRFMVFKAKNQYIQEKEWEIEAKDLIPKQSVRAIRFETHKTGRVILSTRRDICKQRSNVVMESVLGRLMEQDERVHHKDRNPGNDSIDNLILTTKKLHNSLHPEIVERMKLNNPVHNIPLEVLSERARNIFGGRKQSVTERLMRREMQLGANNSNYKGGFASKKQNKQSRIVNHKVVSVEKLPYREDVYCMEVPETHWFYANKVFVHNCSYCYNSKWNKLFPHLKKVRTRDAKDVVREIHDSGARYAFFQDSCFGVDLEWVRDFVDMYTYVYWGEQRACPPFQCNLRPELVTQERMEQLKKANCVAVRMALETASDRLRKMVGRKYKKEDVFNASALLNERKIMFMLQNIIGLPTSTIEDDLETLDMNIMCNPTYSWVSIFQPYPGTVLGDSCKNKGWYTGDYSDISDSFFDTTRLEIDEEHREQLEILQKVWALCVDYEYVPKASELTYKNLPKLVHLITRKCGDKNLYLGLLK